MILSKENMNTYYSRIGVKVIQRRKKAQCIAWNAWKAYNIRREVLPQVKTMVERQTQNEDTAP